MENIDWQSTGRTLGFDIARFGVKSDYTDEFIEQGKKECPARKLSTIFDRKWVRLRIGAYRRRIPFSAHITPQQLHFMTDIVNRCPLTLDEYDVKGAFGGEENWSFDRIDNDVGYTLPNLIPMTTKANQRKGTASWAEICARAAEAKAAQDIDEYLFWYRLRHLYAPYEVSRCERDERPLDALAEKLTNRPPMVRIAPFNAATVGAHFVNMLLSFDASVFEDSERAVMQAVEGMAFGKNQSVFSSEARRRGRKLLEYSFELNRDGSQRPGLNRPLYFKPAALNAAFLVREINSKPPEQQDIIAEANMVMYQVAARNPLGIQFKAEVFNPLKNFR